MLMLALLMPIGRGVAAPSAYRIGVYYFAGWRDGVRPLDAHPWNALKAFPERTPSLGYYQEGATAIAEKQIAWMHSAGVSFIAYDWFWDASGAPRLTHALRAFQQASNRDLVDYALLWANHDQFPRSLHEFDAIVDCWITQYFRDPHYLREDGKPVVFIFAPDQLKKNAARFGASTRDLLDRAQKAARARGLDGIYFVACIPALSEWVTQYLPKSGYSALSAYSYQVSYSGHYVHRSPARSCKELREAYKANWTWILNNSPLPYWMPVSAGRDRRPWVRDADEGWCDFSAEEFREHLLEAKTLVDKHQTQTERTVLVYAWNEFGEGAYLEPTAGHGVSFLEALRAVFQQAPRRP